MQLLSFRKPYEMLPPVPEARMLTHGFAYKHGTFLRDIGLLALEFRATSPKLHTTTL